MRVREAGEQYSILFSKQYIDGILFTMIYRMCNFKYVYFLSQSK